MHHIDISMNECKKVIGVDYHSFRNIVYNGGKIKFLKKSFKFRYYILARIL